MTPSKPPPLRLLERPPRRRAVPARPPAPWWTVAGLRRAWRRLLAAP